MKQLIVNADDLGADEDRNAGIFDAIHAGSVTSVSILANGPAFKNAIAGIRSLGLRNVSLGVHFNLSEGKPVSPDLEQLTGEDGSFLGKKAAQQLLTRPGNAQLGLEIRKELSAQIMLFQSEGIRLDHLDGHQHVHILPAVSRPAAEAAALYGIPWVRIPDESFRETGELLFAGEDEEEARFFSEHARAARPFFETKGMRFTDRFMGLHMKGRLDASIWQGFLGSIPNGLTEFMVHPGRAAGRPGSGPFSGFSTEDREQELGALMDGRFFAFLEEYGVRLAPFPGVVE